jgi:DeoR/GlpR family transcriptional regulator of sugar metabolism
MFSIERKAKLLSFINEKGSILVREASVSFGVTEETIRRDLKELENQGLVIRTHGGAIAQDDAKSEFPLEIRQEINISGKNAIGREAAKLVRDGDTIMLDASTSSLFLAKHVKEKKSLTVITNAEKIIFELSNCDEITLISTGGILRRKSMSYVGKYAENALKNYQSDMVFFSCKGFLPDRGLMDSNEQESQIKRNMINRSQKAIFLCDNTKFKRIGCETVATLDDIHMIVTDEAMPENWSDTIRTRGIVLIESGGKNV